MRLGEEVHSFDAVVLSSGAWVKELLEPLGYYVDVRPQKGQLVELTLETTEDTSKWPVCMLHGEIDILPFSDGKILVGATHENTQGFDLVPDEELLGGMYEEACASLPSLKNAKRSGVRVGTRAYTSVFSTVLWRSAKHDKCLCCKWFGLFRVDEWCLDWRIIGPHGSRGRSRIFGRKNILRKIMYEKCKFLNVFSCILVLILVFCLR